MKQTGLTNKERDRNRKVRARAKRPTPPSLLTIQAHSYGRFVWLTRQDGHTYKVKLVTPTDQTVPEVMASTCRQRPTLHSFEFTSEHQAEVVGEFSLVHSEGSWTIALPKGSAITTQKALAENCQEFTFVLAIPEKAFFVELRDGGAFRL